MFGPGFSREGPGSRSVEVEIEKVDRRVETLSLGIRSAVEKVGPSVCVVVESDLGPVSNF